MSMRNVIMTVTCLASLAGCKAEDPYEDPLEILDPMGTRRGIVYLDVGADEAVFVDPEDDGIDVTRVPVGPEDGRALWCRATRDETGILVMTVPETEKVEDVEEQLHLLSQDGEVSRTWDVQAPYTSVALSPDLVQAVLYFGGGEGGGPLRNANQVAIIDLGSDDVRSLTLNGFGGRLSSIQFPGHTQPGESGLVDIGGHARDIVAFLAEGEVVLVDAADPSADQVAVQFGNVAFTPAETLIRPGDAMFENPALFLRGNGSDVAMLTLVDKPDEATGASGFSAQISLIPIGNEASDFAYYNGESIPFLLTVDAVAGAFVFTDIRTQQSFEVGLGTIASRLLLREHDTSIGPVTQAVAWTPGGSALHTLELDGVEDALGRAPRRLDVATGIEQLVQLDNDRVLIGSGTNLYIVDFRSEQITPLTSEVPYDPASSALQGDLLLLGTAGQSRISTVDLGTVDPESMLLDEPIQSFHYLADRSQTIVVHDDPVGYVTVSDATEPSRATSFSVWGFLLDGALDR